MKTVLGLFDDRAGAETAIDDLNGEGYNPEDVSIIMKDTGEGREMEESTGANVGGGATTGAVVGGIAGLLIGVGTIVVPGIGGLLIGGPLAAALGLSGAVATTAEGALTGTVAGGLIGALVSLGLSKKDAQEYERRIKEGAILLAVPAMDEEESHLRMILQNNDAYDIKSVDLDTEGYEEEEIGEEEYIPTGETYERPAFAGTKGGKTVRKKTGIHNVEEPKSKRVKRRG